MLLGFLSFKGIPVKIHVLWRKFGYQWNSGSSEFGQQSNNFWAGSWWSQVVRVLLTLHVAAYGSSSKLARASLYLEFFSCTFISEFWDQFSSFNEQTQSSHLRDELLMLLGFLSFKGFPKKKLLCLVCVMLLMFLFHLSIVILQSAKF